MVDTKKISNFEIDHYLNQGYLLARKTFNNEDLNGLVNTLRNAVSLDMKLNNLTNQNKIYRAYDNLQFAKEIFESEKIIRLLEPILGPNIVFLKNRHNHVSISPVGSNVKRFHRDILHWSRPLLSVLIYLEDTDVDNGCTWLIPGSNNYHFINPHSSPSHGGTWIEETDDYAVMEDQAVPIIAKKGDVLLMNSLTLHSPGNNKTEKDRVVLIGAYRAIDELSNNNDDNIVLISGHHMYCGNDRDTGA
ncbi:phytanoyl-CoA dioxygenase family protein [Vibrio fluvialis]|nr:phytanoyl-CoA dioxygenase family protein [Vibrio fluvialis]MBY8126633.1 phytanoyl-CoA dioxygenase family protein [Vibrio fluvialis]MBY8144265.1 phytanoyl-CoA dioxygenase family protein [Vibrio fluvialis]MBY8173801.1 phytanoyl-CoA dioxygenase family protein [Vibrio fluvialis]HDM8036861.1 phytanoyl-CoA dioxygenase family protein [Vibrio fluvialis clinical-1]